VRQYTKSGAASANLAGVDELETCADHHYLYALCDTYEKTTTGLETSYRRQPNKTLRPVDGRRQGAHCHLDVRGQ
jgi:hypothetical protein